MASVQGKRRQDRESNGFTRKYGFAVAEIVCFQPETNEEIEEAGFKVFDSAKEPEYTGEKDTWEKTDKFGKVIQSKDDVKTVRLDFYLRELGKENGAQRRKSFYLVDVDLISKENPNNFAWVNAQGNIKYADSEANLSADFKKYSYRKAKVGERELCDFLRASYDLDWKEGATMLYNIKDLFRGKFKDIKEDVANAAGPVIMPFTIRLKKVDTEDGQTVKEMEETYNAFAPGRLSLIKDLQLKKVYTEKDIQELHKRNAANRKKARGEKWDWVSDVDKIVISLTDPTYPCKDLFHLGLVKEYNPEDHTIAVTDKAVVDDEDDRF